MYTVLGITEESLNITAQPDSFSLQARISGLSTRSVCRAYPSFPVARLQQFATEHVENHRRINKTTQFDFSRRSLIPLV